MVDSARALSLDPQKVEKFVEKVVNDIGTALRGGLCYIGDKLRIFKAMAAMGRVTVEELAGHPGLNPRYLREWLGAMVTAGYIEYTPETGQYFLPPEHALALADESSLENPGTRGLWGRLATCGGLVTRPDAQRRLPTGAQDAILPHKRCRRHFHPVG